MELNSHTGWNVRYNKYNQLPTPVTSRVFLLRRWLK